MFGDDGTGLVLGKAIGTLANAVKRYYEPTRRKREADADRYVKEQEALANLTVGAIDRVIQANQEANLSSILDKVPQYREGEFSQEDVSEDWLLNFFDEAKNISDDEVQNIFAAILTGELEHPGSYSKRTVAILKTLNASEAKLFVECLSYCVKAAGKVMLITNLEDDKIPLKKLMDLEESGLVQFGESGYCLNFTEDTEKVTIVYGGYVGFVKPPQNSGMQLLSRACLTRSGEEIYRLGIKHGWFNPDMDFFKAYVGAFAKPGWEVSMHEIHATEGDIIRYGLKNIL